MRMVLPTCSTRTATIAHWPTLSGPLLYLVRLSETWSMKKIFMRSIRGILLEHSQCEKKIIHTAWVKNPPIPQVKRAWSRGHLSGQMSLYNLLIYYIIMKHYYYHCYYYDNFIKWFQKPTQSSHTNTTLVTTLVPNRPFRFKYRSQCTKRAMKP